MRLTTDSVTGPHRLCQCRVPRLRAMAELVVVGQGYVGLPAGDAGRRGGLRRGRLDVDEDRVKRLAAGRLLRRGHHRRPRWPPPSPPAATGPTTDPADVRRLRRRRHHRADAAAGGHPRPHLHRDAADALAPLLHPGRHRGARDHHLPRHHRGAGRPPSSRRAPAWSPAPTSTSATAPSASTPATTTWTLREHAQGRVRHRRRLARARSQGFYDRIVDRPCRCPRPRRPSSPSCSRTPSAT